MIISVIGKSAMIVKKDLDKKVLAKRQKEVTKHLRRQKSNKGLVKHAIIINEMGQNENAVGLANNANFWNYHLCGVNGYILMALCSLPFLIITSLTIGIDFYVKGKMFDFWSSSSELDKMLMKDCFTYFLINGFYPSVLYIKNEKLLRHVKEEFF